MTYQDSHPFDAAKGNVRILRQQEELPLLRDHLLRLDRVSRHDRFQGFMDDSFIERYAAKCADDGTVIIAYFENGVVRGAAELHPPDQSPDSLPEIAFSVEASVRRQGVGSILFRKLIAEARSKGYRSLADHDRRAEPRDAGACQQVRRASDFPPRRIHRQHRSDAATAVTVCRARDRDTDRCRTRNDQSLPRILAVVSQNVWPGPDSDGVTRRGTPT